MRIINNKTKVAPAGATLVYIMHRSCYRFQPEPEYTIYYNEYLKLVELYETRSPKIVRIFKAAHAELMEEWCE